VEVIGVAVHDDEGRASSSTEVLLPPLPRTSAIEVDR